MTFFRVMPAVFILLGLLLLFGCSRVVPTAPIAPPAGENPQPADPPLDACFVVENGRRNFMMVPCDAPAPPQPERNRK